MGGHGRKGTNGKVYLGEKRGERLGWKSLPSQVDSMGSTGSPRPVPRFFSTEAHGIMSWGSISLSQD